MANLLTELLKKLLNISAHAILSVTISLSSKRVILLVYGILSEKKGLTCFQKFLLSVIRLGLRFS